MHQTPLANLRVGMQAAVLVLVGVFGASASAAPFEDGNLLVSTQTGTGSPLTSNITEYTLSGGAVQTLTVPQPGDEGVRDLVVDAAGALQVFNGTFDPWLSTYDPFSGAWTGHTFAGWSIVNNGTYGAIATDGDWIFVTDHATGGVGDAPQGIVRFNRNDFSAERFAMDIEVVDLNIGLNGLLYAIWPTGTPGGLRLCIYEPASMTLVGTMTLPHLSDGYRAVAADAAGRIYVAGYYGRLVRLSPSGAVEKSTTTSAIGLGPQTVGDMDLAPSGRIVIGTRFGAVLMTDTEFNSENSWQFATPGGRQTFVAWVPSHVVPAKTTSWGRLKALYR